MQFLVIGGSGLIGSKVVRRLRQLGHKVTAASPSAGIDVISGAGLDEAMAGTDVVVDLANSPSFADQAVLDFFQTAGRNLAAAETKAGVRHHVALSVVGTDKLSASGYFRGKQAQEKAIRESGIPYSLVHSTQFFEFLPGIVQSASDGNSVRLSPALIQPIVSDDVADAMVRAATGVPLNGIVEIGGPERLPLAELVQRFLTTIQDPRSVISDTQARYFGALLDTDTLIPRDDAWTGKLGFQDWLRASDYARFAAA